MVLKKTHKRKKSSRIHGRNIGTAGTGSRKNKRKSGNKGGVGMAGSGKRANQKTTLIAKIYGHSYFGKQGVTSRKTRRDKRDRISIYEIISNISKYVKKGIAKKNKDSYEINLSTYKILSQGEVTEKLIIKALDASQSAVEKVEKVGGKITLLKIKESSEKDSN